LACARRTKSCLSRWPSPPPGSSISPSRLIPACIAVPIAHQRGQVLLISLGIAVIALAERLTHQ